MNRVKDDCVVIDCECERRYVCGTCKLIDILYSSLILYNRTSNLHLMEFPRPNGMHTNINLFIFFYSIEECKLLLN